MKKALFLGCSYAAGWGFPGEKLHSELWTNQLFPGHQVVNLAWHGADNDSIFHEACKNIRLVHYDQIVVAWTAVPRYRFQFGLELYDTGTSLLNTPVRLVNKEVVDGKFLQETGDRIRRYHNDHWEILKVVQYVNIILELARYHQQGEVWFVNSLLPWCGDYFNKKHISKPNELDPYVQKMLQVDRRDDPEIFDLYSKIHRDYAAHGSINQSTWLNLYSSLDSMKIDTVAQDDHHPGTASQQVFVNKLREQLCAKQR